MNFQAPVGFRLYSSRVALSKQQYVEKGKRGTGPSLPEIQKHSYRIAAEMLLHAYFLQNPREAASRSIIRADPFVPVDLKILGLLQDKPKPEPKAANPFQKSLMSTIVAAPSLSGRNDSIRSRAVALPGFSEKQLARVWSDEQVTATERPVSPPVEYVDWGVRLASRIRTAYGCNLIPKHVLAAGQRNCLGFTELSANQLRKHCCS